MDLIESCAARGAGRRPSSLWPVWGCLARHVELKFLRAEVQGLAVKLLNEGHSTALGEKDIKLFISVGYHILGTAGMGLKAQG